jgi:hypothetical protein
MGEEILSDDERYSILNELHTITTKKKVVEGHPVSSLSPSPDAGVADRKDSSSPESFGSLLEKTIKKRQVMDETDAVVKDEMRTEAIKESRMDLVKDMCKQFFR